MNLRCLEPRHRSIWGAALLAFAAAGLGCNILREAAASPSPGPTAIRPMETPTAVQIFETFNATDGAFRSLHAALESDPNGLIVQAQSALGSSGIETRFAAVYALGLAIDASQTDLLLPVLEDPNLGLRTLAAGALIGLGRVESIPVLIAALGTDDEIPYLEPPTRAWSIAHAGLTFYTAQDFGFLDAVRSEDEAARQASVAAWLAWWMEVGPNLTWDATSERYVP